MVTDTESGAAEFTACARAGGSANASAIAASASSMRIGRTGAPSSA